MDLRESNKIFWRREGSWRKQINDIQKRVRQVLHEENPNLFMCYIRFEKLSNSLLGFHCGNRLPIGVGKEISLPEIKMFN